MSKIAGVDVLLYVDVNGVPKQLGGQNGATINRRSEIANASHKGTNGWTESVVVSKSWSIDCDGYIVSDDEAQAELEDAWLNLGLISAQIVMPSGRKYSGSVLIDSFDLSNPQEDGATYRLSLRGTGELARI